MTLAGILQFAVLGLASGGIYAVMGTGVLSIYRATGLVNFAQGAMLAWGAYVYYGITSSGKLVLPIASIHIGTTSPAVGLIAGVASGVLLGVIVHLIVFAPLRNASPLAQVVASVGVMLTMEEVVVLHFGATENSVTPIFPTGQLSVLGANLSDTSLCVAGLAILLCAFAGWFFKRTKLGVATRAGAENQRSLRLMGYSPQLLAVVMWAASMGLGTLVVILGAASGGLTPTLYLEAIVPALAIVLLARLSSIWVVCFAGLVLGAFQSVLLYLEVQPWWPQWAVTGLSDAVPFLVIIVALVAFGRKLPSRGSLGELRLPRVLIPQMRPTVISGTVAAAVVLMVFTSGPYRFGVISSMIVMLLALSYVLLTGYLGQISLAQLAFAGTSALVLSKLTTGALDVPFPLAVLLSALAATLLGIAVGFPAVRIRGVQLAVVTFGMAVAVDAFIFGNQSLTPITGDLIGKPVLFGLNLAVRQGSNVARLQFGFMVLVCVVIMSILVMSLMRGATGRAFLAIRSNERAAASVGIDVARTKVVGFAVSAFIAGVAGALMAYSYGITSASLFTSISGLSLLATAYLGGIGRVSGAIVAGLIGVSGVTFVLMNDAVNLGAYYDLAAGIGLTITAIANPVGIAGANAAMYGALRKKLAARRHVGESGTATAEVPAQHDPEREVLRAR